jgi:hypothetical protein
MTGKVHMRLIVDRGQKEEIVLTTCAYLVPETPETPETIVKLTEELKKDVSALIDQMWHELRRRREQG